MITNGEFEVIRFFNVRDIRRIEYVMYFRPLDRSLILATEDFSSFNWDLDDEMNQQIRDMLAKMFHESDTVVADSIRILQDTP